MHVDCAKTNHGTHWIVQRLMSRFYSQVWHLSCLMLYGWVLARRPGCVVRHEGVESRKAELAFAERGLWTRQRHQIRSRRCHN